jgi:single-strand DNA-binding protein
MFTKLFRIGNQPVIRFTQKGDAVLGLSLAYAYGRKGEDGKRPTQWIDASLWGKQAEALSPFLVKGNQVSATIDDLHIEEFDGKTGPGYKMAGRVINIELVSSGERKESAPAPSVPERPLPNSGSGKPAQRSAPQGSGFDDMPDDLPF